MFECKKNTGLRFPVAAACMMLYLTGVSIAAPTIRHTLLISGTGLNYVGIVDTAGKILWKHDEAESGNGQKNDCWLLPNGNVVYSYQWGVRIVDVKTNKVIWDRPTPKRNNQSGETHSCQPLDGGSSKFLLPECFADTAFIVEVDTAKKEWRRIGLRNQGGGTHGKWRQIRKTAQNTYLVSSYDLHHSYEYDTTGRLIRDFPAGGYVAVRLANGNTLTGTGDDCRFVEFDATGTKVWEINNTTSAIGNLGIGFGSEAVRLPNGNTIITNWGGHGTGFGPAVVEVKPDRSVVGTLPESFAANIASVKVIDGWSLAGRQFTISANAGPNGTIEPSGAVLVDSAASKTFTISPDPGYAVDSVMVDGIGAGAVTTYTFTAVKGGHAISVVFKKPVSVANSGIAAALPEERPVTVSGGGMLQYLTSCQGVLKVYDGTGRLVARKVVGGPGRHLLHTGFAPGMYSVTFENSAGSISWKRTVVVGRAW